MAGADFVGLTATLNTFIFKVLSQLELKEINALKGKKVGITRIGGERAGFKTLSDLSRLDVPYTLHGIGTRKILIREDREIVIRYMKAYLEGIYLFKTNKELALSTLKKYARLTDVSVMRAVHDEYAQRLIETFSS